eukprot:Skav208733  [mRNA]  locus=scaffold615:309292:310595:+ [translate_table: standard]
MIGCRKGKGKELSIRGAPKGRERKAERILLVEAERVEDWKAPRVDTERMAHEAKEGPPKRAKEEEAKEAKEVKEKSVGKVLGEMAKEAKEAKGKEKQDCTCISDQWVHDLAWTQRRVPRVELGERSMLVKGGTVKVGQGP